MVAAFCALSGIIARFVGCRLSCSTSVAVVGSALNATLWSSGQKVSLPMRKQVLFIHFEASISECCLPPQENKDVPQKIMIPKPFHRQRRIGLNQENF